VNIDVQALLTLSAVPGIGPNRLRALVSKYKSTDAILRASVNDLISVVSIDKKTARNVKSIKDTDYATQQLSLINKNNARIVTIWDKEYPRLLKNISDPPAILFVKGGFVPEDCDAVAIVGMRQPSEYGKLVTEKICSELAAQHITIISGLARGIDTRAHKSTLQAGGEDYCGFGFGS